MGLMLGRKSRAFMVKAGAKIKAESLCWSRPQHLLSSEPSHHHRTNSLSWRIGRASYFDGPASEMVRDASAIG